MQRKNRLYYLDNTKFILTLLIVLYHIDYVGEECFSEKIFLYIKNLGDCVVPAFSMISGFLFFRCVKHNQQVYQKMNRRVLSLVVPYISWNMLNTLVLIVISHIVHNSIVDTSNFTVWKNFVLWDSSPHLWYIFMLIVFTVLAPLLYKVYENVVLMMVMIGIELIYVFYKGDNIFHSYFCYILYTWGGLLGILKPNIFELIIKDNNKLFSRCILCVFLYFSIGCILSFVELGMLLKVWLYALRAIVLILTVVLISHIYQIKVNFLYTFWLFLVHYWLDCYIGFFVGRYCTGIIYQVVTFSCVMIVAIISGYILSNFSYKLYTLLTGAR